MEITTLRLPETLRDEIDEEAGEEGLSFAEYARRILRNRHRIPENTDEDATEYDERIRALEQRVEDLEQQSIEPEPEPTVVAEPEPPQEGPEPDVPVLEREGRTEYESNVVEFVRVNQPVSRSDILDHCTPDDFPGKPESWWTRHGQDELKKAGGSHTRNRGWSIEDEGE